MPCTDLPRECLAFHAGPRIAGWRLPSPGVQGTGECPACSRGFSIGLGTKGARLVAYCHAGCQADEIRAELEAAGLWSGCMPSFRAEPGSERAAGRPSRARAVIEPDELAALALAGLPPASLRLALLELSGMTTGDALDKLGIRREHRSRTIAGRTNFGAKPQVSPRTNSGAPTHDPSAPNLVQNRRSQARREAK